MVDYTALGISEANDEIGSGSFSVVYKGTLCGQRVAVKKLRINSVGKTRAEKEDFVNELKLMARVGKHPNVIGLLGCCNRPLALIVEFAELGSLDHALHGDDLDRDVELNMRIGNLKKRMACQIADGLRAVHAINVVHRDVKPANGALRGSIHVRAGGVTTWAACAGMRDYVGVRACVGRVGLAFVHVCVLRIIIIIIIIIVIE